MLMSALSPIILTLGLIVMYRYYMTNPYIFFLVGANIQRQSIILKLFKILKEKCMQLLKTLNFAFINLNASVN